MFPSGYFPISYFPASYYGGPGPGGGTVAATPGTVVTVNGVPYDALSRARNRLGLDALTLTLTGYDSFEFHEFHAQPFPSVKRGWPVSVSVAGTVRFTGWVIEVQSGQDAFGWKHGYSCRGLRWYVDRYVPVTAPDGTGTYQLNTPPDNVYGVPTDRGLTLGVVVERLLTVPAVAKALHAVGVGGYTTLTPPTLPPATLADLALLTVVPPLTAIFSGLGIFGQIDALVGRWMPRFAVVLGPDGVLRFPDLTDVGSGATFEPRFFTLASQFGRGDPIPSFPTVKESLEGVATNFRVRGGPNVEGANLSLVDGTLAEGFTPTDKSNWTLYVFTDPGGAEDHGTITTCTSTSATVQSSDAARTWAANFWNGGTVFLENTTADTSVAGVTPYVFRQVTASDAMSAAGTAVIRWDASWPTAENDFNAYRMVTQVGDLANCWRLYLPRDPHSGNTGLNTVIGRHMVRKSSVPIRWSNKTTTIGEYYTQGVVAGPGGASLPLEVEPVPSLGGYMFTQPTVTVFGQKGRLDQGSPTTVNEGLPSDVQVFALYSTSALSAVYPADDPTTHDVVYQGTASDTWQVTQYLDVPSWTWASNQADMTTLAEEYFKVNCDSVIEVDLAWNVCHGVVPAWPYLDLNWALNIDIAGTTSPWSSINCPIRSVMIGWQGMPVPQTLSFSAGNLIKPFTGDDLYTHPQFAGTPALASVRGSGGLFGSDVMPQVRAFTAMDVITGTSEAIASAGTESAGQASEAFHGMADLYESMGPLRGDGDQFTSRHAHQGQMLEGNWFTPEISQGTGFRDATAATPGLPDRTPTDRTEAWAARTARTSLEAEERDRITERNALRNDPALRSSEANMARASRRAAEEADRQAIRDRKQSDRNTRDMLAESRDDGGDTTGGGG